MISFSSRDLFAYQHNQFSAFVYFDRLTFTSNTAERAGETARVDAQFSLFCIVFDHIYPRKEIVRFLKTSLFQFEKSYQNQNTKTRLPESNNNTTKVNKDIGPFGIGGRSLSVSVVQ